MLQIIFTRQGQEVCELLDNECVIGRLMADNAVDLELGEPAVSRRHTRIWREQDAYWIEDLKSRNGTFVNGTRINEKFPLRSGDTIRICDTTMRVRLAESSPSTDGGPPPGLELESGVGTKDSLTLWGAGASGIFPPPAPTEDDPCEAVRDQLDADASVVVAPGASAEEAARRLEVLYRMSREFTAEKSLDGFAQLVVARLMESCPRATRGSFALYDRGRDALLLKAGTPQGSPGLSETLARRAMAAGQGFIWDRKEAQNFCESGSIASLNFHSGMYAPLLWQGQPLGVLCVDDPKNTILFGEDELRLLLVVAQSAAPALANHLLQKDVEREAQIKANLLRQFSPRVAKRLLNHRGRTRLGGTRSEVTVLCSDIRGFTRIARDMEPDEVVDLLNSYFALLVPILSSHDGTVDKFVGDAVLAVFGSPDPDDDQYRKAVRAAWKMQAAIRDLNGRRADAGDVRCGVGIGIHCGEVVHGFVGSAERMEFTVIGDAVNYASRYCDGAGDGQLLISPEVYQHVWKIVKAQEVSISTKHEGSLRAYRVEDVTCAGGS